MTSLVLNEGSEWLETRLGEDLPVTVHLYFLNFMQSLYITYSKLKKKTKNNCLIHICIALYSF